MNKLQIVGNAGLRQLLALLLVLALIPQTNAAVPQKFWWTGYVGNSGFFQPTAEAGCVNLDHTIYLNVTYRLDRWNGSNWVCAGYVNGVLLADPYTRAMYEKMCGAKGSLRRSSERRLQSCGFSTQPTAST
nr:hypothetical protein [uncultured Cupriavidus sp.]